MHSIARSAGLFVATAIVVAISCAPATAISPEPTTVMRAAMERACAADGADDMEDLALDLPGLAPAFPIKGHRMMVGGWRKIYPLEIGHLTIDWLAPRGHLHHIRLQLDSDASGTPLVFVMVDQRCAMKFARAMEYDNEGHATGIAILGDDLAPTGKREPVDPPVPEARDPGGIPVAVVDTGVNYTLSAIAERLSRKPDGRIAGYDFWDMDARPFDANPHRSAFFPARHGTAVSSFILGEAPVAEILPYRFPRPDMSRFRRLVIDAAENGARVMNISLASYHEAEWTDFQAAAAAHPDILFVVAAGNNRRNIDRRPVFPAAFQLPNLITVTASKPDGFLVKDANWGPESVDIAAPAYRLPGMGFDGSKATFTGSSYAAARISALAVCLMAREPGLDAPGLRKRILQMAKPMPYDIKIVAHGFIANETLGQHLGCIQADEVSQDG